MTREEAAEHLKEWREVISSSHRKAVIDMAIEALSAEKSNQETQKSNQETQKSNGDLINRADAIEAVCDVVMDEFNTSATWGYDVAEKAIEGLPSAEAVSRKAKCCPIAETCMSIDCPVSSEYIGRPSAEATCATCADRALCIMSAPDGKWKACKDYRAEAVNGEWIKTVDGNGWNEWWVFKCPFCGATIEDKQRRSWEYNFCPNCGARMKGGGTE